MAVFACLLACVKLAFTLNELLQALLHLLFLADQILAFLYEVLNLLLLNNDVGLALNDLGVKLVDLVFHGVARSCELSLDLVFDFLQLLEVDFELVFFGGQLVDPSVAAFFLGDEGTVLVEKLFDSKV